MKIYEVTTSKKQTTLEQALELAAKTGVLEIPEVHACLHVAGGMIITTEGDEK